MNLAEEVCLVVSEKRGCHVLVSVCARNCIQTCCQGMGSCKVSNPARRRMGPRQEAIAHFIPVDVLNIDRVV